MLCESTISFRQPTASCRKWLVLALLFVSSFLTGCGTMGSFRELREKGDTIYVKGSIEIVQEAAVRALAEKRLTGPEFEKGNGTVTIYAEQGVVTGVLVNSYGGYGKVTIVSNPSMGAGIMAVSAITRSRAAHEPVGSQDVLKGYNYNNPLVARQILESIKEQVNAKAPG